MAPFTGTETPTVLSLSTSSAHNFSKKCVSSFNLIAGLGIEGDAHAGVNVQHRSRLHIKPPPPNLRQVHLMSSEQLHEYRDGGHSVQAGDLGENILTKGLDLLALGVGTRLKFMARELVAGDGSPSEDESDGDSQEDVSVPTIVITGVRNPCPQIEKFQKGLQEKCIVRDGDRKIIKRKAGIMATVEVGGLVTVGSHIKVIETDDHIEMGCV